MAGGRQSCQRQPALGSPVTVTRSWSRGWRMLGAVSKWGLGDSGAWLKSAASLGENVGVSDHRGPPVRGKNLLLLEEPLNCGKGVGRVIMGGEDRKWAGVRGSCSPPGEWPEGTTQDWAGRDSWPRWEAAA